MESIVTCQDNATIESLHISRTSDAAWRRLESQPFGTVAVATTEDYETGSRIHILLSSAITMLGLLSWADELLRVLFVAGPALGDILLATPLMASIRRQRPDARIDVLVYNGQAGILEGNPDIDGVLTASKHPGFREYIRLLRRIRRRYDIAISNKQTDRAVAYAWVAGRMRIAVVPPCRDAWKRWCMSAWVPYDHDGTHTLQQNNALGALLGLEPLYEPRLPTASDSAQVIDKALASTSAGRPFAVLHPNPGLPYKRWNLSGWIDVARYLERRGISVVVTGGGTESEMTYLRAVIRDMPQPVVNLAGKLRLADLTELLGRCALYVGTDTVATHMAAAIGVPTIALFGPESPRVWGPWPHRYVDDEAPFSGSGDQRVGNVWLVQSAQPCNTCRQGYCVRRSSRGRNCNLMQTLAGTQVVNALDDVLQQAACARQ